MSAKAIAASLIALLLWIPAPMPAAEADAIAISGNIRVRHMPFGTILDPFLDDREAVTGYTRCGDSAIWTGHYLAAEAFRYQVSRDPEALANARAALYGIQNLIDVTATDVLARCYVPKSSPYAAGILREEAAHGIYEGRCLEQDCYFIGNTSRDQYIGVFFGLAVAFELIDDARVRATAEGLATRLLDRLLEDAWAVRLPGGEISTVFWHRPDQKLGLLAVGAKMNPRRFAARYQLARFFDAALVGAPAAVETLDEHNDYFKFNLDALTFFLLLRDEGNRYYRGLWEEAYALLRRTTDAHGNAHFNMIDRALRGPDASRDEETRRLLEEWLQRPRRDAFVDLRGVFPSCFQPDRACDPIPVPLRVRTDFLWQRSPFLLFGGGAGNIETAGIDYILPYWMARYYGVL